MYAGIQIKTMWNIVTNHAKKGSTAALDWKRQDDDLHYNVEVFILVDDLESVLKDLLKFDILPRLIELKSGQLL